MPELKPTYNIFFSFAHDVEEERRILYKSQRIVNAARRGQYRVEILDFKNDTYPDSGASPQSLINAQIGFEYDIYLSIIKHRIGTPTQDYISGVIEEFELARANNISTMLFFCENLPLKIYQLDPVQYQKVSDFRNSLGSREIKYATYDTLEDFDEKLIKTILAKVDAIHKFTEDGLTVSHEVFDIIEEEFESIDFGLDDLSDFDEFIEKFELSIFEFQDTLQDVLDTFIQNMKLIENKISIAFDFELNTRKGKAKSVYKQVASRLLEFKKLCDAENENLDSRFEEVSTNFTNAFLFFPKKVLTEKETSEAISVHENLMEIIAIISQLYTEINSAKQNIFDLRKFSSHLRKAQKSLVRSFDETLLQINKYQSSIEHFEMLYIEKVVDDLISDKA